MKKALIRGSLKIPGESTISAGRVWKVAVVVNHEDFRLLGIISKL